MTDQQKKALEIALEFVKNLDPEISFVISENEETHTKTIGRGFVEYQIAEALK